MENKQLLKEFEEFLETKKKAVVEEKPFIEKQLTMSQTIWINLVLFVIVSFFFDFLTKNIDFLRELSLFSWLMLSVSIPLLIWRVCDVFIFKEFDLFKGFEENPIAKSIFALAFFIYLGLVVLATSGTIVFKPNAIETETRTEQIIESPRHNNSSKEVRPDTTGYDTSTKEN